MPGNLEFPSYSHNSSQDPSGSFYPTSLLAISTEHMHTHKSLKSTEQSKKYTQGFRHTSLLPSTALTETSKISPRAKEPENLYAQARLEAGRPRSHLQPGQDDASTRDPFCCKSSPPWAAAACLYMPGVQGKQHCSVSASLSLWHKGTGEL